MVQSAATGQVEHSYIPPSRRVVLGSGIEVDVWSISPEQVDPRDLAQHGSQKFRFGGACRPAYSIAQHMVEVSKRVALAGGDTQAQGYALLHDCGECFTSDVPQPHKVQPEYAWLCALEARILAAVHVRFGLEPRAPKDIAALVHAADRIENLREARWLLANREPFGDLSEVEALPMPEPMGIEAAEAAWFCRALELFGPNIVMGAWGRAWV